MNPALPTGLVIPTYTLPVNIREAQVAIGHTRHRFRDMFPTNLGTAYNADIIII